MDQNVKRHIPDGLQIYQSQQSRSREIPRRLPKNKQDLGRMQKEKKIGKEGLEEKVEAAEGDGEVDLVVVEEAVEEKEGNEDVDIIE